MFNTTISGFAEKILANGEITREEALKLTSVSGAALFRFIHPTKNITICGGREKTLKEFQSWIYSAEANALMSGDYLTTRGRSIKTDMEMIKDLGLRVSA